MYRIVGGLAERLGAILVSPEYIYGRKWGYKASAEEHHAVADVLSDAALFQCR